LKEIPVFRNIC